MKPNFKISTDCQVLTRILLVAMVTFTFLSAHAFGDVLNAAGKLDAQIVLALKKSRGEAPFDKPTSFQPDIPIRINGRIGVDIKATVSPELLNKITLLGGKVVKGSATGTTLQALIPLGQIEALAARAEVKFISPARPIGTSRVKSAGNH